MQILMQKKKKNKTNKKKKNKIKIKKTMHSPATKCMPITQVGQGR